MSGINQKSPLSLLPDDIENLVKETQDKVNNLRQEISSIENDLKSKKVQQEEANIRLSETTAELNNKSKLLEEVNKDFINRENIIKHKESALEVYANALAEKEKKINKYLIILGSMKDVISK
jgi:chromosome segregation ATPase